ncbi:MAG: hypothetical protein JO303_05775 [Caulobacteraceae bacterium]|nr:hypothetical protein [Caulobacteraceae bacterium]
MAIRAWAIVMAGLTLGACASQPPPTPITWTGGDPAHLAADEAACRQDSAGVDINNANGYSDPEYGPTSAMAAAINRDSPLTDQRAAVRSAAFAACMTNRGWKAE